MKTKRTTVVFFACAILTVTPALALATTSWHGSDYSFNSGLLGSQKMTACDMESDSRHVYAEFQLSSGEISSVTDGNGANNSCASRSPYQEIWVHRTCEAVDFYPDLCGSWEYT